MGVEVGFKIIYLAESFMTTWWLGTSQLCYLVNQLVLPDSYRGGFLLVEIFNMMLKHGIAWKTSVTIMAKLTSQPWLSVQVNIFQVLHVLDMISTSVWATYQAASISWANCMLACMISINFIIQTLNHIFLNVTFLQNFSSQFKC